MGRTEVKPHADGYPSFALCVPCCGEREHDVQRTTRHCCWINKSTNLFGRHSILDNTGTTED
jgi:hypothetical protein